MANDALQSWFDRCMDSDVIAKGVARMNEERALAVAQGWNSHTEEFLLLNAVEAMRHYVTGLPTDIHRNYFERKADG